VVRVRSLDIRRGRRDQAAGRRAAPAAAASVPARPWARAYGLIRDPGSPQRICLIGPGSEFDPGHAMTTDPGDPVIIATVTTAAGEPAGPLLIDGCHRLYKAAVTGREHLPSLWLTAAETLAIRRTATLGPGRRRAARTENQP
jgi:hypothetical protein